jgi:hypothetical protein
MNSSIGESSLGGFLTVPSPLRPPP